MIDELVERFRDQFGRAAVAAARAPGRVNLIGEHTDYNEGLVLPCAIDRATWVAMAPRDDGVFRVVSRELAQAVEFRVADLGRRVGPASFVDYARGAVAALREQGMEIPGADLGIVSQVPLGSGLSSSAALCVALIAALDAGFGLGLSARQWAERAHRAENAFAGVPCGVMDAFASALAREGHALRIDCRSHAVEAVPLPPLQLLVAHSGVTRRLASGRYAERRRACERAFALAKAAGAAPPQAKALRDLEVSALPALEAVLPRILLRRARHVITENARVDATCAALRACDRVAAGLLLQDGMRSLRDDFEVSLPELDALCEIGDATPGVFGSRLTGAGFGGCTLHLVEPEAAENAADVIAGGFEKHFGRRPEIWSVTAAEGAARQAV